MESPSTARLIVSICSLRYHLVDLGRERLEVFQTDGEKAGGNQLFIALRVALCREKITRYLFLKKSVIRFISIERVDHIVTVSQATGYGIFQLTPSTRQSEPHPTNVVPSVLRSEGN